ncbi:MAG TPA: hypothetical protein VGQ44_15275 [Gemmatimonadaceae bacterium]|nr:hypothetical protein [Gemmatimonadaceae bacterium]
MPWFALVCIALAIFCGWSVVQLSPQKSLFATNASSRFSRIPLPDSLQFVEDHAFVVVVTFVLALIMWAMFRRPRSR